MILNEKNVFYFSGFLKREKINLRKQAQGKKFHIFMFFPFFERVQKRIHFEKMKMEK